MAASRLLRLGGLTFDLYTHRLPPTPAPAAYAALLHPVRSRLRYTSGPAGRRFALPSASLLVCQSFSPDQFPVDLYRLSICTVWLLEVKRFWTRIVLGELCTLQAGFLPGWVVIVCDPPGDVGCPFGLEEPLSALAHCFGV